MLEHLPEDVPFCTGVEIDVLDILELLLLQVPDWLKIQIKRVSQGV